MAQDVLLFPANSSTVSALNNYGWYFKKKFFFHYAAVPIEYFLKVDKLNTTNLCCDLGNLVFN